MCYMPHPSHSSSCSEDALLYLQPATRGMWQWGTWLQNCSYSYHHVHCCQLLEVKIDEMHENIHIYLLTVIKVALLYT
jgi:hypothetical protein